MFLPQNMSEAEKSLAAEVARGILAKEQPTTPGAERHARAWAEQVAAEMIWAARNPTPEPEALPDSHPDFLFSQMAAQPPWEEDEELLDVEWEEEYRSKEADRVYREAWQSGKISRGDDYPPAEDISSYQVEIEIPPRPR